ncbi:fungal hydrophobin domain-containing protein [Pochonia chlamydosporia 170]|uniref:Fungal hydrophobin domain-containing protein n=1 Tax=Pochonia chlamydosporia 170 TaxID=1380566 RepID=A0A179FBJ9_METCM|nr:fungal hydrophobin domain-containing protein [Pochonia chlamydosporia 170]OAQ62798.1 fungal hydrophobin domain-containing protein [Pochonia chlamydosporia 170]
MKFTTAVLALAATAVAVPTGDHGGNNPPSQCNNNGNYVCCNGLLGGLLCIVDVLGNSCSGGSYCCKSAPQGGLINIGLDCLKIL